jgi:hypothetical protein
MQMIGMLGFANSGKSTVGNILVRNHGFHSLAFADTLKDVVSVIFGWERHLLEGDTVESRIFRETEDKFWSAKLGRKATPRIIMQQVGTDAMRDVIDKNIWVHALEKRIANMNHQKIVITDVRFENEINCVRNHKGQLWRVFRGETPSWYDAAWRYNVYGSRNSDTLEALANVHSSEWTSVGTKWNHLIENDGTLEDLEIEVNQALQTLSI